MLGSPAGPGAVSHPRGFWPLTPNSVNAFSSDDLGRYGVYSLFPSSPSLGGALYSHSSAIGRFASGTIPSSGSQFHTSQKESLFSSTGYTFGAPTPPPVSPYSPVTLSQLELFAKGYNSNIIIQQSPSLDFTLSPKKGHVPEKQQRTEDIGLKIKPEKSCGCLNSPGSRRYSTENSTGCSRTTPIDWTCSPSGVSVKKEPGASAGVTPCQVAEVTTSASPIVKVEITSPNLKSPDVHDVSLPSAVVTSNGNIPLGIAVARQRFHNQESVLSPSLPPAGLLTTVNSSTQIKEVARTHQEVDSAPGMAASTTGGVSGGSTLLQCTDERATGLAGWSMGGNPGSALTAPTLWQYPGTLPIEPMLPLPTLPVPPMGVQLVRDPTTGHLLLLPTATGMEQMQQAVVWPSYSQPPSVLLPSIPPPPLQLLSSASSDFLSSSTTLHHHTQTHSTRFVAVTTTDTKRKIPLPIPTTTLIKIEADATPTALDHGKTLQTVSSVANNTAAVFADQTIPPLVATHLIYQHPSNLILSQNTNSEMGCRSQATSPVQCLTPPPETTPELEMPGVQDASNQTETPFTSEDDNTIHAYCDVVGEVKAKQNQPEPVKEKQVVASPPQEVTSSTTPIESAIPKPKIIELSSDSDFNTCAEIVRSSGGDNTPEPISSSTNEEIIMENTPPKTPEPILTSKPDISGLELLSNSIFELENSHKGVKVKQEKKNEVETVNVKVESDGKMEGQVDDNLGGLNLLCALAEQRILEEVDWQKKKQHENVEKDKSYYCERRERKKEKRRSHKQKTNKIFCEHYKCKEKDCRSKNHHSERSVGTEESDYNNHHLYKSRKSEEDVRKYIASKSQSSLGKEDWPMMNAMELDMRQKLAELQRKYKEKQQEFNKLKPKRKSVDEKISSKKRKSKKRSHSERRSITPPPVLDKIDSSIKHSTPKNTNELLRPPTLCAIEPQDNNKSSYLLNFDYSFGNIKRTHSPDLSDTTLDKYSSSKKRKVGRPKKLMSTSGLKTTTETIVAKKPKKGTFVGYLLAAKEKLQMQSKSGSMHSKSPPRYVEDSAWSRVSSYGEEEDLKSACKIRPKLKAEATVREQVEDEESGWEEESVEYEPANEEENDVVEMELEEINTESLREENKNDLGDYNVVIDTVPLENNNDVEVKHPNRCTLTTEHLKIDKLRVLTVMAGLFYAGNLNAIEPPDVYSITLDGERGNRPHIMSREEILRDAIVEISPKSIDELPIGTRLCAYWSQQYRCLYPGSVSEPVSLNPPLDSKFVAVEFDDGDSGTIALEDIRLLPPNYPIMEYDPNPLLSLSKRKRRISANSISNEEKRLSQGVLAPIPPPIAKPLKTKAGEIEKENKDVNKQDNVDIIECHKERKRLKKKKKEKLKQKFDVDRKKKKKHKCCDEHCKHRKHHKKHRKHKKHHHNKDGSEERFTVEIDDEKLEIFDKDQAKINSEKVEIVSQAEITEDVATETDTVEEPDEVEDFEEEFGEYEVVNPDDEVTMDDIIEAKQKHKSKKIRDRQESCESRSKMTAFLPARQLWSWSGKGYKRSRAKGRCRKVFYKAIQRGKEVITVGDAAVFLSTGRPDRPYIGKIESMWESYGTMIVRVKWFYHPEETSGCPPNLQYPGALFESPHLDENDVQTISHKCDVLALKSYREKLRDDPKRYATIYDNNDIYYLAGYYDPSTTTLKMEEDIPVKTTE